MDAIPIPRITLPLAPPHPRVLTEWMSTRDPQRWPAAPDGDGQPVMLVPGFMAGDTSLTRMALWLRGGGYILARSGITRNTGCMERDRREPGGPPRGGGAPGRAPRAAGRAEPGRLHRPRAGRPAPRPDRDAGHARVAAARPARGQGADLAVADHRRRAGHGRGARHVRRQLPARRLLRAQPGSRHRAVPATRSASSPSTRAATRSCAGKRAWIRPPSRSRCRPATSAWAWPARCGPS